MEDRRIEAHGVRVRRIRALRGPNVHAYKPVLEIELDIGPYEDRGSHQFPGFVERLTGWLPGLERHGCSVGRPGGFVERLRRGTYLAHIAEHVTIELQNTVGFDVAYGRARGTGQPGVYRVVVAYEEEEPARAAFDLALHVVLAAMHGEDLDMKRELARLEELADDFRLGPSTAAIARAARRLGVPVHRLTPRGSLLQLGFGVHQKRIRASETSGTSALAVELCQEKPLTNLLLRAVGVPVPEGRTVRTPEEAWATAEEIGVPVVVKPEAGNQGKGVSVGLRTEAEVRRAFEIADGRAGDVLVERHVAGRDFRLLVVGGRFVAAARRDPAAVVGDGQSTVRALIDRTNGDPRRRPGHSGSMTLIEVDDVARLVLGQQGLSLESVPAAGQVVRLRENANLSTGGTATDVTDDVHPSNARLAELAAQILTLDVAGIDIVCEDIGRPVREQGGAIVEVNAAPGLRMHLQPAVGIPRDVGEPIIRMLYPDGTPARIPILAVTGTNGKTTVVRLLAHMFETGHKLVGHTSTEGTFIGRDRILDGDCSGPKSARAVLMHPRVEVAVLETARGGILREGLAFDRCSVGIVTNVSSDHLGMGGVDSLEALARVKQVVIESVAKDGAAVLNADDPRVAEMAAATDAKIVYFARRRENLVLASHLAAGGLGVFVSEAGEIVASAGGHETPLVDLGRVPFTLGGRIGFQVANALAAVAGAWAAGLNPALIVRALTTFQADDATVPARFNRFSIRRREVILDYAHNEAAVRALGEGVAGLGTARATLVISLPGDRRDEDILATMQAASWADRFVFHDQRDRRGRHPLEVPRMLASCVPPGKEHRIVADAREAILEGLRITPAGEALVVIADEVGEALEVLHACSASTWDDERCTSSLDDTPDLAAS